MTTEPTEQQPPRDILTISVNRTHAERALQVNLAQLDAHGRGTGYRIAGPKHYNMGTTELLSADLSERDAREIRAMLDAVYPPAPVLSDAEQPAPATPRPAGLDALLDHVAANLPPSHTVLAEVAAERVAQDAKWGEQNHNDGTGNKSQQDFAEHARKWCKAAFGSGYGTWSDVLAEEVAEANAERDPAKLRAELVQVAAVAVCWIEAIDRRNTPAGGEQA